jgi:hypothetical protein
MFDSLKRFQNAKTLKELFVLMTYKELDILAAVPLMLFLVSPAVVFWQMTFIKDWTYEMTTNSLMTITAIFSVVVMSCDFSKQFLSGRAFREIIKDYIPHLLFLIMAVLILISTLINGFTENVLLGDLYRGESVFSFLSYILCFFGCAAAIRYERTKRFLLNSFLIASAFISVLSLLDYSGVIHFSRIHLYQNNAFIAVFYNSNHFGYYLAISAAISFAMCIFEETGILRFLYVISLSLHTATLVMNRTRGSSLACLCAVIVMCLVYVKIRKHRLIRIILPLTVFIGSVVIGFAVLPQNLDKFMRLFRDVSDITVSVVNSGDTEINVNHAGSGRWLLWKLTVGAILQKPVFGWGTEGISGILTNSDVHNSRPHNEYLQYAAFYGIPACLCYLAAAGNVYFRAHRKLNVLSRSTVVALTGALAYLISACFGNTMFYTTPFLFILLGLGFRSELKD